MANAIAVKQDNLPASVSPYTLIQSAIEKGADVESLERLLALSERYEAGVAKKEYIAAMQRFQSVKPDLAKSQAVSFGQGKTSYKFCPLPEIEKSLRGPLSDCGLSYRFENLNRDGDFGIRCVVTHLAGHSEATEMYAPADSSGNKNAIQAIGSTSTYLMRYVLIAAFALTTADEDDDGASNSDLPFQRAIEQSKALHNLDNLRAVVALKEALAEEDYDSAAEYMHHMGQDLMAALWIAPTKAGIFTTKEIGLMKSNEMAAKRSEYAIQQTEKGE